MATRWKRILAREWMILAATIIGSVWILVAISAHLGFLKGQERKRRLMQREAQQLIAELEAPDALELARNAGLRVPPTVEKLIEQSRAEIASREAKREWTPPKGAVLLEQDQEARPKTAWDLTTDELIRVAEGQRAERQRKTPPIRAFFIGAWERVIDCAEYCGLIVLVIPYLLFQFIRSQIWAIKTVTKPID